MQENCLNEDTCRLEAGKSESMESFFQEATGDTSEENWDTDVCLQSNSVMPCMYSELQVVKCVVSDAKSSECGIADSEEWQEIQMEKNEQLNRLFVGNIPFSTTRKELLSVLKVYGKIRDIVIPYNEKTRRPKG